MYFATTFNFKLPIEPASQLVPITIIYQRKKSKLLAYISVQLILQGLCIKIKEEVSDSGVIFYHHHQPTTRILIILQQVGAKIWMYKTY